MARSHSHNVKLGEARKARRRKRHNRSHAQVLVVAWVCDDPWCVGPHGTGR